MAEFCKECFIKLNELKQEEAKRIVLSRRPELCEGCGRVKPVVVRMKRKGWFRK